MQLLGEVQTDKDLSGGTRVGDWLVLVSDESRSVILMQAMGEAYAHVNTVELEPGKKEFDLEGVTADGDTVYVCGSHSAARKELPGEIGPVRRKPDRDVVFRFRLKQDGSITRIDRSSLRQALDTHAVLAPFANLASKENGIDIEGLAFRDGLLYFGFRSPVLRDNWVPVLVTPFDSPISNDVRYIRLGGRGIRDLVMVSDGFLVLAGPPGDGDQGYQLFHWNGVCALTDPDKSTLLPMKGLHGSPVGKLEGMILLEETSGRCDVLLLSDGPQGGHPQRIGLTRM
jgi:Protein of unknown function (DUF3616)